MLTALFQKMKCTPLNGVSHRIVVDTFGDDMTRGDVHGSMGIAQYLARRMRTACEFVNEASLNTLYPALSNHDERLRRFLKDTGNPDIILGKDLGHSLMQDLRDSGIYTLQNYNETLSREYINNHDLVAHHLTPQRLSNEGKIFREHYANLPGHLIAVLLTSLQGKYGLVEKLTDLSAYYKEATFFVCGCHRTEEEDFEELMQDISLALVKENRRSRIRLMGYNFRREQQRNETGYNPYIGLIDQADHVIVSGDSHSMLSEVLATGKTPHLHAYSNLRPRRIFSLSHDFNGTVLGPLDTQKITPVNKTQDVAEAILKDYVRFRIGRWSLTRFIQDPLDLSAPPRP